MYLKLGTINEVKDLKDKRVLVRVDTDADVKNGRIIDDTRLVSSVSTISYLLKSGAKVIIIGHLGRPQKKYQISNLKFPISNKNKEYTLKLIAAWFKEKFKGEVEETEIGEFPGWKIKDNLFLLENIRFYEGEENPSLRSGQALAEKLAGLGDLYVNEAFAVTHRDHVSVCKITKLLPSYAGFHLSSEIEELSKIINDPKRPLVVLIGGAKIETKLPMVEKMHQLADYVLVGGEIAEQDKILIKVQHEKIQKRRSIVFVADNKENGLDITEKSIENFIQIINTADTIVWNGPVGLIRSKIKNQSRFNRDQRSKINTEDSEYGTLMLAEAIVKVKGYKVVGGGDTLAFLKQIDLLSKFDFVSTGGGAMLEFLSGKKLPGIIPLLK